MPVRAAGDEHMKAKSKPAVAGYVVGNYVAGQAVVVPSEAATKPVFNPATGTQQGEVVLSDLVAIDVAVVAAKAAFPAWAATPPARRAQVLFRYKRIIEERLDELAVLVSAEHGKTVPDARGEVSRGLEMVDYCTAVPELLKGEYSRAVGTGVDTHNVRSPLGVCAGITPFNFPAMVPMWMYVPAIACGNTFLLKPSERDPSASLKCAEWLSEAGLPDGVFNVVQGDKVAVDALLTHADIKAVSFVGSTPIAQYVYATAAANGKRVQALGGAKNHMVVLPDADIVQAADALMGAAYGSAGERCMAISVAVPVGEATADALVAELKPRVAALRIGSGTEAGMDMGPLITAEHRDRVSGYIDQGEREGAEVVVDGRTLRHAGSGGYFLGGTLLDRVTNQMSVYTDEIFGPVLSVVRVVDATAALELVNSHQYGNGAAIFTRDGMAGHQFAARVEAGMVGINVPIPVPVAYHSFGGWKDSLFGSNAIYGPEGLRFYTKLKTITTRWPDNESLGAEFTFPQLK